MAIPSHAPAKWHRFALVLFLSVHFVAVRAALDGGLAPLQVATWPAFHRYTPSVEISGNRAFIKAWSDYAQIDISDPARPRVLGRYEFSSALGEMSIISQNQLLVREDFSSAFRMWRLDFSNPAAPVATQVMQISERVYDMAVAGTMLYTAGQQYVRAIDMTDPALFRTAGRFTATSFMYDVAVFGTTAYAADINGAISVLDFANPAAPRLIRTLPSAGSVRDIVVEGDRLFVAAGELGIFDLSSPLAPVRVGVIQRDFQQIAVEGNTLLAASGTDLTQFDVSNPALPVAYNAPNSPAAFTVALAGQVSLAGSGRGLHILAAQPQAAPVEVGQIESEGNTLWMSRSGNNILMAEGASGFRILNAADPSRPVSLSLLRLEGETRHVTSVGNTAYVTTDMALHAVNIADPANPIVLGSLPGRGVSFSPNGGVGYFCSEGRPIDVVDISDPANLRLIGAVPAAFGSFVLVRPPYAMTAGHFLDISDPAAPTPMREIPLMSSAALAGNRAYINGGVAASEGFRYADFSDLPFWPLNLSRAFGQIVAADERFLLTESLRGGFVHALRADPLPALIGNFPMGDANAAVFLNDAVVSARGRLRLQFWSLLNPGHPPVQASGHYTENTFGTVTDGYLISAVSDASGRYILQNGSTFKTIDISTPGVTRIVSSLFAAPGGAKGLARNGNLVFAGADTEGIKIIDLSNVENPQIIGSVSTPGIPAQIIYRDNRLFVAATSAFLVIDVANPRAPTLAGQLQIPAAHLQLVGATAYVAGSGGLRILNISNPQAPAQIGLYAGSFASVAVTGTTCYLGRYQEMVVVDVSTPSAPALVRSFEAPAMVMAINGRYLYTASDFSGLNVYDLVAPSNPTFVSQNTAFNNIRHISAETGGLLVNAVFPAVSKLPLYTPPSLRAQTIDFAVIPNHYVNDPTFALSAVASSGLPVTFAVVSGPAAMQNGMVDITGAGFVTIRASQAGDATWAPAAIERTFEVTRVPQTITFGQFRDASAIDDPFTFPAATSSSGLSVTYAISGPGALQTRTVTLTGPGVVRITASQAGNATYLPAAAERTFTVRSLPDAIAADVLSRNPQLPQDQTVESADPDGDGIPNVVEFILRSDPASATSPDGRIVGSIHISGGARYLRGTFPKPRTLRYRTAIEVADLFQTPYVWRAVTPSYNTDGVGSLLWPITGNAAPIMRFVIQYP